ncbi:PAS domain-containing hybrid sensor histidine kinase/response regulator [Thauera linaloolentis]|uniref:Sensory/regulatory protein RpfC n=1 Tax=Thauera linaloolentis (strain DSM 12138 / JCM 21573 / CCUG 41526 / CIP 105981 / IAM 15112 / NBRC 102519 / 47Lol) TaxID=1123367 RepID=N6YRQ7_THAL4|nr:PAS domain-containing hybrid sensor histidine kinase/response regulator [Thauera linaloolentis]ENO85047.1 Periplasmic hybrid histidine protein kinase, two-component [Thauera linaloolentis 47Lol = DSM 12138]MCM8567262.1 response regulator [Thauera linaloolentis]
MKLAKLGSRLTWALVGLLAAAALSVVLGFMLARQQHDALDALHRAGDAATRLQLGKDLMVSAVRNHAATGDDAWRQAYLTQKDITRSWDETLEAFVTQPGREQDASLLLQARRESAALAELETQIFAAVQRGDRRQAMELAHGEHYRAARQASTRPLVELDQRLQTAYAAMEQAQRRDLSVATLASVLLLLLGMAMLVTVMQGFYRRRVLQPLVELTGMSARMLAGEHGVRYTHSEESGEIGDLSRALQGHQQTMRELDAERERLRRAEAWYRQIIEFSPDGMLIVDADGRIVIANPKAHEQFGYQAGSLAGLCVDELVPADLRPSHPAMRARFTGSGGNRPLDNIAGSFRAAKHDGSEFPVELGLTHLPDLDGQRTCTCVTVRDITQRKAYEQTIASQLAFQRVLLDTLPHPMFFKDDKGCYLGFNQAFLDAFGVTQEALLGKSVLQFMQVPAEDRPTYQAANDRILREGGTFTAEMRLPFADGRTHDVLYSLRSHSGSDGAVAGLVGALIDISVQKQAEQAQIEAKHLAEEATRLKSDFLANMSHEIRTPMNVIMGMAHLALDSAPDPRQRNYLEKIHAASETLLGIINDILDFSKIEAGKMHFEETDFFLEDVLGNLADLGTAKAQDKGLELLFDVGIDVPTGLRGDPLRLGQVLNNLLSNALKFTEQGEVTVTIRQEQAADDGAWLYFEVSDTGIGIGEEQRQHLFQAFAQADTSTSRRYGGTGLGLTICKHLVELMGGEIGVDSEPGIGSTFYFRAPFRLQSRQRKLAINSEDLRGMRILVVDDNASAREILQGMLRALKFDVTAAPNAARAITLLEDACAAGQPYRLVLMDWMMPGTGGIDAIRQIRTNPRIGETPFFVMVTAFCREELRERIGGLPVAGLLEKPITPSTLLDSILGAFGAEIANQPRKKALQIEFLEAQRALRGTHLLLVEDNVVNQEMSTDILGRSGVRVDIAGNGAEALSMVARTRYDGILMDCQMPVMDGFEATRRIRRLKDCEHLPIIAMTANAMNGDRERCLEAGMDDHISKPIDVQQLFIRLHQWIKLRAPRPEQPGAPDTQADTAPLPAIPGLQMESALQRLGGDDALLHKLLRRFCETQSGAAALIAQALADGDKDGATRFAHTLKGLAGTIGARALASCAADVETRLHHGTPVDEALRELAGTLEALTAAIQGALGADEASRHDGPAPEAPAEAHLTGPAGLDALRAGLLRLEALLRDDDGEAGGHLDTLIDALAGLGLSGRAAELQDLVAQYRFDEALASLDGLRRACPALAASGAHP